MMESALAGEVVLMKILNLVQLVEQVTLQILSDLVAPCFPDGFLLCFLVAQFEPSWLTATQFRPPWTLSIGNIWLLCLCVRETVCSHCVLGVAIQHTTLKLDPEDSDISSLPRYGAKQTLWVVQ